MYYNKYMKGLNQMKKAKELTEELLYNIHM